MQDTIHRFIDEVANLNVLVIGETIIDEFVEVAYEGQSMKSFCPVFRLAGEKLRQEGGVGAITNHLRDFVGNVEVITNTNDEIVKTRYIDIDGKKKHVEVNKFETAGFDKIKVDTTEYDVVIVADFGHGFCDKLDINNGFYLMCQTNSNNFGFNRISKWKNYHKKSVCIDLREASLQMNRRIKELTDNTLMEIYNYEVNADYLFVTLGAKGATFTDGGNIYYQSSFKGDVVDTIGAGDTFFAFSSLMPSTSFDKEDYLLIPSLAANLSTTWLCNERSVTKEALLQHADKFIQANV